MSTTFLSQAHGSLAEPEQIHEISGEMLQLLGRVGPRNSADARWLHVSLRLQVRTQYHGRALLSRSEWPRHSFGARERSKASNSSQDFSLCFQFAAVQVSALRLRRTDILDTL